MDDPQRQLETNEDHRLAYRHFRDEIGKAIDRGELDNDENTQQWLFNIDRIIAVLEAEKLVLRFNTGDIMPSLPPAVGSLAPDVEQRHECLAARHGWAYANADYKVWTGRAYEEHENTGESVTA